MTQTSETTASPGRRSFLIEKNRNLLAIILFGLSAALVITLIALQITMGWQHAPVRLFLMGMVVVKALTGLWLQFGGSDRPAPHEMLRLEMMVLGGAIGFLTVFLGLALPLTMYSGIFAGGLKVWQANAWRVLLCAGLFVGGLFLMFASLQLGRGAERTNATVRRVLYGYNALLSFLLVLSILGIINVLSYAPVMPFRLFAKQSDWTAAGLYSLQPATTNFLTELDKPVTVYLIISEREPAGPDAEILLNNFKAYSNQFTWKSLSRDLNRKEVEGLLAKYEIPDSQGMLVVYGSEPNQQQSFIRLDEIYSQTSTEDQYRHKFKGEGALMKALTFLAEDKKKPIVYFTQGSGEPSLSGMGEVGRRGEESLRNLKDVLTKSNYEIKELHLTPTTERIPADAEIVVIAGPKEALPKKAVDAFTSYMNPTGAEPKGKLIVLLDVAAGGRPDEMLQIGLEPLLNSFSVEVGNQRVFYAWPFKPITTVVAVTNRQNRNPLASNFRGQFLFEDARTVEPASVPQGARAAYRADVLLQTDRQLGAWQEAINVKLEALVDKARTPEGQELINNKVRERPQLPLAVTVVETLGELPSIPQHTGVSSKDDKPRLIVFGDAGWITDESLSSRGGKINSDFFVSCLSWLRQRSNIGSGADVEGISRKEFTLSDVGPGTGSRLTWVPVSVMLIVILGMGSSIWLIRRR